MTELFSHRLTVCIDAANLSGMLALAPTLALVQELSVDTRWLPLTAPLQKLSSRKPDEPAVDPLSAYKARRARAREMWARSELARDCERLGIGIEAGQRRFDGRPAGMGMLYLDRQGGDIPAWLGKVYDRAFRRGADVSQLNEIVGIIDDDEFEAYAEGGGPEELEALQDALLEAGVFSSPAYVLGGEVFQGRQHLPLIRDYLMAEG